MNTTLIGIRGLSGLALAGAVCSSVGLSVGLTPGVALAGGPGSPGVRISAAEPRPIDLAICLDTSGSMDGLIEAAKQKLWAIVNELARATPTPKLRVALLTFGNDGHPASEGWVDVQTPFTQDLDVISDRLFRLSTNGGTELVGRVLHRAGALDWHSSSDALKLAIVAGNESADQDRETPYREVCRSLIGRGIIVNAIYCGPTDDTISSTWREVARLAEGTFAAIDQDGGTLVIDTPFDERLAVLSTAINTTYIPFGQDGQAGLANQLAQDLNAAQLNQAAVAARCTAKGGALYVCARWDLVDASRDPAFRLAEVAREALPEKMQSMTTDERQAHVAAMAVERARYQQQIAELTREREDFLRAEMKRRAIDDSNSFDNAVRSAVRAQAIARGFRFD